jgi:hypothetical protein
MTPAQRAMCFAEWKKCWDTILLARDRWTTLEKHFFNDEKAARAGITRKAIGVAKSWGDVWGQKQVDHLLAVMWAISQGSNLELQLRQVDQPLTRAEGSVFAQSYLDAIRDAALLIGADELVERLNSDSGRESYLNGICRRIHKCELADIADEDWQDILSALNHTRLHKEGRDHNHPKREEERQRRQAATAHRPAAAAPRTGSIVPQAPGEELF